MECWQYTENIERVLIVGSLCSAALVDPEDLRDKECARAHHSPRPWPKRRVDRRAGLDRTDFELVLINEDAFELGLKR